MRAHAVAVNAAPGDTLVLVFRVADGSLQVVRVGAGEAGKARLQKLLGHAVRKPAAALAAALDRHAVRKPAAALAAALDCRQEDVGALLRGRGDDGLAAMLDANWRTQRTSDGHVA